MTQTLSNQSKYIKKIMILQDQRSYQTEDSGRQWLRDLLNKHPTNAEQAATPAQKNCKTKLCEHPTRSPHNQ